MSSKVRLQNSSVKAINLSRVGVGAVLLMMLAGCGPSPEGSASLDAGGTREELTAALANLLDAHGDSIVDYLWNDQVGTVVVKPQDLDLIQEYVADFSPKVVVVPAMPDALARNEWSTVETEALALAQQLPGRVYGAAYRPALNVVVVEVWAEDQKQMTQEFLEVFGDPPTVADGTVGVVLQFEEGDVPPDLPVEE